MRNINSKLSTYISDRGPGYSMQAFNDGEILWYDIKINVQQIMLRYVIDWYHLYRNHPGGIILEKTIRELWYWKSLFMQADMFAKTCKMCQQFKKRKAIFGNLPPNNISELKPWYLVHIYLIGTYSKYIIQQHSCGSVVWKNVSLTWMRMIDPATGRIKNFEIPMFDLDEVTGGNDEYIYK